MAHCKRTPRRQPVGKTLLLAILLASCGGANESVDPPVSGTPASIAIAAGDQQQAAAGGAVTVAPAVTVRDAAQKVLSGVTVQFAVAAGGGTLQQSSAVTDGSGVARVGGWTLGTTGEQRITATAGSLPAVTFHATILIPAGPIQTSISPIGGSFEITTPGHPYKGLRLAIPSGTFSGTEVLLVAVAQNPSLPSLSPGFRVSGPVLEVTSSQVRGSKLMTLHVPIAHGANERVLLAFHDPVRHITEIMPTVYRDDSLLVVLAAHLRPDLLAGPGIAGVGSSLRGTDPVGWLMPIAYQLPMPAVSSVLASLSERWPVLDYGSASQPDGFGPAIPIMQALAAAMDQSLAQLDAGLQTPGFYADPAQLAAIARTYQQTAGTTSAMLAQYDAASKAVISGLGFLRDPRGTGSLRTMLPKIQIDELANHAILASLSLSGKPQLVALIRDVLGGPPIFATAVAGSETSVNMLMPSAQAIASLVRSPALGFQSIPVLPVGDQPPVSVGQVVPLSSFLVDFQPAAGTFTNLLQTLAMPRGSTARNAANDQMLAAAGLPLVSVETQADVGTDFIPGLQNIIMARSRTIRVRITGGGAGMGGLGIKIDLSFTGAQIAQVQGTDIIPLADVPEFANAANLVPTDVVISLVAQLGGPLRQLTASQVRVIKAPFDVTPVTSTIAAPFTDLSFTASVPMPPATGYSIEWAWGDGNFTENSNSTTATHQFVVVKDYKVIATLLSKPDRKVLAVETVDVQVNQVPFWRILTLGDPDDLLGHIDNGSGEEFQAMKRIIQNPTAGMISIEQNGNAIELRIRAKQSGVWSAGDCCPVPGYNAATEWKLPLGFAPAVSHPVGPFFAGWGTSFWNQSTQALDGGTLTGQYVPRVLQYQIHDQGTQTGPGGGFRFTGTRNGNMMTGEITVHIWLVDVLTTGEVSGTKVSHLPFTAMRIR